MNTLILLASIIVIIYAVPIKKIDHISYLHKFGYLVKDSKVEDKDVVKAIKEFQVMASIKPTGFMNKESEQKMQIARCGNHDKSVWASLQMRVRKYAFMGTKWYKQILTYKITKYSKKISHAELDNSAAKAFKFWSEVIPLQFRQVYGDQHANINIQFVYGRHDDKYPFDGPGGIIGHAFQPDSGRVDMDESEAWTLQGSYDTINIVQVLTHEFGHALGLKHSDDTDSVMQPFYDGYKPNFKLGQDDVNGIQALYGRRTEYIKTTPRKRTTTTTTTTTTKPKLHNYQSSLCKDARFDAIAVISDAIMAFKGSNIYILNSDNPTRPRSIHRYYPGVPANIDAVINNGKISTFIKDNKVYVFKYNSLLSGYPKPLNTLYPGLPISISAAFTLDKYVYFVTRSGVYYKTAVSPGSRIMGGRVHRTKSPLRNAPSHVDTMFHSAEGTFAFTGNRFHMALKDRKIFTKVMSTSKYWFNCS